MNWLLISLGFCCFGLFRFITGYVASNSSDILIGGILLGLGLNISLLHPASIVFAIIFSVAGFIFLEHWYYGLFGFWMLQSIFFVITQGPLIVLSFFRK